MRGWGTRIAYNDVFLHYESLTAVGISLKISLCRYFSSDLIICRFFFTSVSLNSLLFFFAQGHSMRNYCLMFKLSFVH